MSSDASKMRLIIFFSLSISCFSFMVIACVEVKLLRILRFYVLPPVSQKVHMSATINIYAAQLWYKISFQNSTYFLECSRYPHPKKSCTLEVLTQVSLISFIRNYLTLIVCSHCVKRVQIRSFFQSECAKIQTRKNSVFGHISRSLIHYYQTSFVLFSVSHLYTQRCFLKNVFLKYRQNVYHAEEKYQQVIMIQRINLVIIMT